MRFEDVIRKLQKLHPSWSVDKVNSVLMDMSQDEINKMMG